MAMKQKIIWKICLIIGISGFILMAANVCTIKDYSVRTKWIYINETEYPISYLPEGIWTEFNVAPNDTTVYMLDGEGPKDMQAEDVRPPLIAFAVVFEGVKIDTLLADSLRKISSYEYKKIRRNNFEFIFRFTGENLSVLPDK